MVTLEEMLASARARLDRVTVDRLDAEVARGALLVDIRPLSRRQETGELPGAMVVDRNELEWRLAPSSEHRGIEVQPQQKVIVVCNDGYQSSLAAAILQDLGVHGATDLVGGYNAWREAHPIREGSAPPCHPMPQRHAGRGNGLVRRRDRRTRRASRGPSFRPT